MVIDDAQTYDAVLAALQAGLHDRLAGLNQIFVALRTELRGIARAQRQSLRAGDTLSTTALVNEAYLKLHQTTSANVATREHFMAIAARAMRYLLLDHLRQRCAGKRGGGARMLDLDDAEVAADDDDELLRFVGDGLDRLEAARPRLARVVYLRFFAGMTDAEIGAVLGVDQSTVRRDWQKARGWLHARLSE